MHSPNHLTQRSTWRWPSEISVSPSSRVIDYIKPWTGGPPGRGWIKLKRKKRLYVAEGRRRNKKLLGWWMCRLSRRVSEALFLVCKRASPFFPRRHRHTVIFSGAPSTGRGTFGPYFVYPAIYLCRGFAKLTAKSSVYHHRRLNST